MILIDFDRRQVWRDIIAHMFAIRLESFCLAHCFKFSDGKISAREICDESSPTNLVLDMEKHVFIKPHLLFDVWMAIRDLKR